MGKWNSLKITAVVGLLALLGNKCTEEEPEVWFVTAKTKAKTAKCRTETMIIDIPQLGGWMVTCTICPKYKVDCKEVQIPMAK